MELLDTDGLYDRSFILRDDLRDHPKIKKHRPPPVGIAGSSVQQFEGTNLFQWYVQHKDAIWRPHGPLIQIFETDLLVNKNS